MQIPTVRPRRLRASPAVRAMVSETSVQPRQLVLPMFVREGITEPVPIGSMPGVVQHSRDSLVAAAVEAAELGLGRSEAGRVRNDGISQCRSRWSRYN